MVWFFFSRGRLRNVQSLKRTCWAISLPLRSFVLPFPRYRCGLLKKYAKFKTHVLSHCSVPWIFCLATYSLLSWFAEGPHLASERVCYNLTIASNSVTSCLLHGLIHVFISSDYETSVTVIRANLDEKVLGKMTKYCLCSSLGRIN